MKLLSSLLFAVLLISCVTTGYSQKLKKKHINLRYMVMPEDSLEISNDYYWKVTERIEESNGATYEFTCDNKFKSLKSVSARGTFNYRFGNNQDAASRHYWYRNITRIRGAIPTHHKPLYSNNEHDTLCSLEIEIGPVIFYDRMRVETSRRSTNGNQVPQYNYEVELRLKITMTYRDEHGNVINTLEQSANEPQFVMFPRDMKSLKSQGYPANVLEQNFNTMQNAFLDEMKLQLVGRFIASGTSELTSKYYIAPGSFSFPAYYKKNKKGGYDDLEAAVRHLESARAMCKGNFDLKNNENWYTPRIQEQLNDAYSIYEKVIQEVLDIDPNSRFDATDLNPMLESLAWLATLTNRFDKARWAWGELIDSAPNLIKRDLYVKSLKRSELIEARYNVNKTKYGWK